METTSIQQELERTRAALRESEARFREIIERNADAIVVVDETGRVRFVNPAAAVLFGRATEDLIGGEFGFPVVTGETTEIDVLRGGGAHAVAEMRVVRTEWEGQPAFVATLRDVTERNQAEEAARELARQTAAREAAEEAQRRANLLAEASRVMSATFDYDDSLRRLAARAARSFCDSCVVDLVEDESRMRRVAVARTANGRTRTTLAQQRAIPQALVDACARHVAQTGQPLLIHRITEEALRELEAETDSGITLSAGGATSLIVAPLCARSRILGAVTFISTCPDRLYDGGDLELAEELATRAALGVDNARLFEAAVAANQAKTDFLARMSHELRTPLNAVIGYADLILGGVVPAERDTLHDFLNRIRRSASHLAGMIDDILGFDELERESEDVRLEIFRLGSLLEEVRKVVGPMAAEKDLTLEFDVAYADAVIRTDPSKLREILVHLLSNAIKFTEQGSVTLGAVVRNDIVCFDVSDTGIGIAPEHLERVFSPFWQVERAWTRGIGGAGIGLSLARRLARLLGGDIRVRSSEQGSTFCLRLPAHDPDPLSAELLDEEVAGS